MKATATITPGTIENIYDDISADAITVDSEFRDLIAALTEKERELLEKNLEQAGRAIDPLVAWRVDDTKLILLDGHNRLEICKRLKLPFSVAELRFLARDEAAEWINLNQLGRRNLTKEAYAVLLGRLYNATKKSSHDGGKGRKRSGGNAAHHSETTAQRIAREHGVHEKTVRNAAKMQKAAAALDLEHEVLSGGIKANAADIIAAAAELPATPTPEDIQAAGDKVRRKSKAKRSAAAQRRKRKSGAADKSHARGSGTSTLRDAVAQRWQHMRQWDKHWGIADMPEVRKLFLAVIREEQKLNHD